MAETVKFGTLYLDGSPMSVGTRIGNENIMLGKTVFGKEIQWVRLKSGMLIASRCVCTDICWEQLARNELLHGMIVLIDDKAYLCRCLKGNKKPEESEWDLALNETGNSDDLWHWSNAYFWCQEESETSENYAVARGCSSARRYATSPKTNRSPSFGFRPVLEPLILAPDSYEPLIGTEISPMAPGYNIIHGKLVAANDYDLVLESEFCLPDACAWAVRDKETLIIDRASIKWLRG